MCLCWVCGLVVDYGLWVGDELGFWGLVWGFCGLFGVMCALVFWVWDWWLVWFSCEVDCGCWLID